MVTNNSVEEVTLTSVVDSVIGPITLPGDDVEFTIVVTNNSVEDVTIDELYDSDFNLMTLLGDDYPVGESLAPGASWTGTFTQSIAGDYESGVSHENTATVVASDNDGNSDTASDDATVTFTNVTASIDVEKYVSVDGGVTWLDADSPEGPLAVEGANVKFKFVVTNNTPVVLRDITLTDSDFALSGVTVPATLAPGASFEGLITVPAVLGQHSNTATASGSFTDGAGNVESATDTDDANYYGIMANQPSISINSLTAFWVPGTPTRSTLTGVFNITDESEGGNAPDGFEIALTSYQVDWELYLKKRGFQPYNGYTCTYYIVDIDSDTSEARQLIPGESVVFDESVNLRYVCTFTPPLPSTGTIRGTVTAGIFNRTDKPFTYSASFSIARITNWMQ